MGKKSAEKTELVIVTGLSGAGKSRAVDALEDIGFFCVDNMPPKLIPTFVKLIFNSNEKRDRVAIVADIRLGDSFSDIFGVLDELKEDEINYKILFIDADNDVIMRRYQETRRKHPLADEFNTPSILEAIQKEREILLPARLQADYIVDTSNVTSSQFKERIAKLFLDNASSSLKIYSISFGFKFGIPKEADLVFDVRCLPNPFYIPELKYKTGLDQQVREVRHMNGYDRIFYPPSMLDRCCDEILAAKEKKLQYYADYEAVMKKVRRDSAYARGFWQKAWEVYPDEA